MAELIGAIICSILAAACIIVCVLQFKEKGFLFNNAYIWASKQEREKMDKKPHYRQSAIVFALLSSIFVCGAIECIIKTGWLCWIAGVLCVVVLIYAIASSVRSATK